MGDRSRPTLLYGEILARISHGGITVSSMPYDIRLFSLHNYDARSPKISSVRSRYNLSSTGGS